jgi:hypothetical protein
MLDALESVTDLAFFSSPTGIEITLCSLLAYVLLLLVLVVLVERGTWNSTIRWIF